MMNTFSKLIIFGFLLTIPVTASSEEITMNFVRIDESADQTVGEKLLYEIYKRAGIEITITPMPAKKGNMFTLKDSNDLEKYDIVIVRGVQHTTNITRGLKNLQILANSA